GAPSKPEARRAVAVLGFKNLSGKAEFAWLSTAFAEMLGSELSAGERLRVIPSENVARTRMELGPAEVDSLATEPLARVQKSLGADILVVGTYLALGDKGIEKVRLDVRIEDASLGRTLSSIS